MDRLARFVGAGVLVAALAGLSSTAQAGSGTTAAQAWDEGWTAGLREEAERETVSGEAVVVAAYAAVWVLVLLYVVRLSAEVRALKRDTEELRRRLDEKGGP